MAIDEMLVKLKALQAGFGLKLPGRLAAIDAALQDCRDQPQQQEHLETLHRQLHTMAGSAGTFGYDALGVRAREFEQEVKGWLTQQRWSERDLDRLALLLPELKVFLEEGAPQNDASDVAPSVTPQVHLGEFNSGHGAAWIAFNQKPGIDHDS